MARPKPAHPAVQVHLYLPAPLVARMKAHAERRGLKLTKAVEAILEANLDVIEPASDAA